MAREVETDSESGSGTASLFGGPSWLPVSFFYCTLNTHVSYRIVSYEATRRLPQRIDMLFCYSLLSVVSCCSELLASSYRSRVVLVNQALRNDGNGALLSADVVACTPRRPVNLLFAVDARSPSPSHTSHIWQVAFKVVSGIRMDDDRVRVTFVPEEASAGRRPGHGELPSMWGQQAVVQRRGDASMLAGNRTSSKSVVEVVGELVDALRRHHKRAVERSRKPGKRDEAARKRRGRRRRTVGVYVTDGRSLDTAGTVYHLGRLTRRLPRRVDLFGVGVGREISGAQLTSVARGRLDRVLTVFTGSSTEQSFNSLRKLWTRLSRLICRRR